MTYLLLIIDAVIVLGYFDLFKKYEKLEEEFKKEKDNV